MKHILRIMTTRRTAPKALLFVAVLCAGVAVSNAPAHALHSAAWVNSRVRWQKASDGSAKPTVVDWENDCTATFNENRRTMRHSTDAQKRAVVNASAYNQSIWLTRRNDPRNINNPPINAGDSVPMQINDVQFLCAIITMNPSGFAIANDHKVTNSRYPNDRAPVPDSGAARYKVNQASRYESNSRIYSAKVVKGPGSITGSPVGKILGYKRDNNSRYWSGATIPFTYKAPANLAPGKYTITIDIEYATIQTYHAYGKAGTSRCTLRSNGEGADVAYGAFSRCERRTQPYLFTFTVKSPIVHPVTCGGATFNPAVLDPETPFGITASVRYGSAADAAAARGAGDKMFVRVNGPGLGYNNANVTPTTLTGTTLSGTANVPASHDTGSYTVTYGMTGAGAVTCNATITIADQPTVTTTDGSSGAGMSVSGIDCAIPADPKGGLVGWNKGTAGNYGGAGTKYGALALNHLQDFATAQGTAGLVPSGLAFANTVDGDVNVSNGLFGGLFGGLNCTRDYFANATNIQNGNVTINGQAVANGTTKTTYVKGNVYITGNVTFSGTYANKGQIPSFNVVVQGNIYIAPGVTQLDGLYVAQPILQGGVPRDGVIYTCAPAPFTAAPLDSTLWANCHSNTLTVNGSLVARQLWLERAAGTLNSNVAAENVNFTPELWLTIPPATGNGSLDATKRYDAITSLPPVL